MGGPCQLDRDPAPGGVSARVDDGTDYKAECAALRARVEELENELASRRGELGRERVGQRGGGVPRRSVPLGATQVPALIHWRLDGTVTRWNDAARCLFGWSEGEAVGRRLSELVAADPVSPAGGAGVQPRSRREPLRDDDERGQDERGRRDHLPVDLRRAAR